MNNKRKKLDLVQRILKQAIEMSSNSIIDVFVEYSSHVELFTVRVFLEGWKTENKEDYRQEIWFRIFDEETNLKQLEEILKYLEEVQANEINR